MKRVNAIFRHPLYQTYYRRLEEAEQGRIFCRHQMTHRLDVARIAYIRSLEEGLGVDREVIYAAAVLHDIGKVLQYKEGKPQEITGEKTGAEILASRTGENAFSETEKTMILTAIRGPRKLRDQPEVLERLLYESDKASRMCFVCPAEPQCDWNEEKKNKEIRI